MLSLQNISKNISLTQNNLSTGLKINSAIDNPSSFYVAKSLINRANDLNTFLDSIRQAIQTIKTATTALEDGAFFLEQATAIATQVREVPLKELPKSWFEKQAAMQNGTVVSTAEELKAVVRQTADAPELIVIYGKIDINLDDTDFKRSIELKDGQKLVGTEYFSNIDKNALYRPADNKRISELNITTSTNRHAIRGWGTYATISDLTVNSHGCSETIRFHAGAQESYIHNVDVNAYQAKGEAICIGGYDAGITISGEVNLYQDRGLMSRTIWNNGGNITIDGTVNISSETNNPIMGQRGHVFTFTNKSCITLNASLLHLDSSTTVSKGAKIGLLKDNIFFEFTEKFNVPAAINKDYITKNPDKFSYTSAWKRHQDFRKMKILAEDTDNLLKNYNDSITQYDSLINDAYYKGTNLLKGESLLVGFNEDRSSFLNLNGKKMYSESIGIKTNGWCQKEDVAASLKQIADALTSIRSFQTELGNNYSILSTRQDFTENLINVLIEGSDKLTLADMNEESAKMLALQTRQQLATNVLSLANQANLSIFKLF